MGDPIGLVVLGHDAGDNVLHLLHLSGEGSIASVRVGSGEDGRQAPVAASRSGEGVVGLGGADRGWLCSACVVARQVLAFVDERLVGAGLACSFLLHVSCVPRKLRPRALVRTLLVELVGSWGCIGRRALQGGISPATQGAWASGVGSIMVIGWRRDVRECLFDAASRRAAEKAWS
jgi:hypothetical protein